MSVAAKTRSTSAIGPLVTKILLPLRMYLSPFLTAVVARLNASEPLFGSLMALPPMIEPSHKTGQELLLLRLGPVVDERDDQRPHVGVDRKEEAVVLAAVAEPLERGHGRERILREAAVFLGNEQAMNAETGAFLPRVAIENRVAVVLDHVVMRAAPWRSGRRRRAVPVVDPTKKSPCVEFSLS